MRLHWQRSAGIGVFNADLVLTGFATQVLGLVFLANAALLSRPRRAIADLLGARTESLAACLDSELRKIQSLFGFGFLFVGLALNLAGFAPTRDASSPPSVLLAALLGLVFLLASVGAVGASRAARSTFKRHLREFFRRNRDFPFERHMELTKELGEVFGIPRSDSDSVEEYVAKVRRALGIPEESLRGVRTVRPVPTPIRPTAVGH